MASKVTMKFIVGLFLSCVLIGYGEGLASVNDLTWVNDWEEAVYFTCQPNEVIHRIASVHWNSKEDRLWGFECAAAPSNFTQCVWSGYANNYDSILNFQCFSNAVIAGVHSVFDKSHDDRQWQYLCCELSGNLAMTTCIQTPYVNEYDEDLDYKMPDQYYWRGVHSTHSNNKEDRIWLFNSCQYTRTSC
ncbi:hemagglutinin/amebocyte aggregation factor-like [Ptychodera flava]|uniref:hemagglutinin/amebocyte aggregation factor-like n=1 Tax=Ptychodera flava TaxID=63121 RepID=UPI00396A8250